MLRVYEGEFGDREYLDALLDDAYIRGLQDMKDAFLLFCSEIYDKNMEASKIWNALDKFLKSMDKEILNLKEHIIKTKFPETWINHIPKIEIALKGIK